MKDIINLANLIAIRHYFEGLSGDYIDFIAEYDTAIHEITRELVKSAVKEADSKGFDLEDYLDKYLAENDPFKFLSSDEYAREQSIEHTLAAFPIHKSDLDEDAFEEIYK